VNGTDSNSDHIASKSKKGDDGLGRIWKKADLTYSGYYFGILLDSLTETTTNFS